MKTRDLHLAAFILATGIKLTEMSEDENIKYFHFEDTSDTDRVVREYWNNGLIGVSNYTKALKDLKQLIFSKNKKEVG